MQRRRIGLIVGCSATLVLATATPSLASSPPAKTPVLPAAVFSIGRLLVSPFSGGVRVPVTYRCNGGYRGMPPAELIQITVTEKTPHGVARYYLGHLAPQNQPPDAPAACTGKTQSYRLIAVRDAIFTDPPFQLGPISDPGAYLLGGTATVSASLSGQRLSGSAVAPDSASLTRTVRVGDV